MPLNSNKITFDPEVKRRVSSSRIQYMMQDLN